MSILRENVKKKKGILIKRIVNETLKAQQNSEKEIYRNNVSEEMYEYSVQMPIKRRTNKISPDLEIRTELSNELYNTLFNELSIELFIEFMRLN